LHGVAVAILQRAVEDYRNGKPRQREDAREFIRSAWFSMLAEGCQLDPVAVRERLQAGRCCRGCRLDVEAVRERLRCNDAG